MAFNPKDMQPYKWTLSTGREELGWDVTWAQEGGVVSCPCGNFVLGSKDGNLPPCNKCGAVGEKISMEAARSMIAAEGEEK